MQCWHSHVGHVRDQTGPDVDGDTGVAASPNDQIFGLLAVEHACLQIDQMLDMHIFIQEQELHIVQCASAIDAMTHCKA